MSRTVTARGAMELQRCDACDAAIYPSREICPSCLSDGLTWRKFDGAGEVLAGAVLSHSFDAAVTDSLPLSIVSLRLDIGPVVIAFAAADDLSAGDRVRLALDPDKGALVAHKTEEDGEG